MENTAIIKGVNVIKNDSPLGCNNVQPHSTGECSYIRDNLTHQKDIKVSIQKTPC